MTITEVLAKVATYRPNQYTTAILVDWLSELDGQIYRDLMATRADAPDSFTSYSSTEDLETELLATFPDDVMYVTYLLSKIDWQNAEYERYNNELIAFNTQYQRYAAAYNNAHLPTQLNALSFWGTYDDSSLTDPLES